MPLFPLVGHEYTYHGSFWGNFNDLSEVIALSEQGKVQHTIQTIAFEDVIEVLEQIRAGDIVGRAVIKW